MKKALLLGTLLAGTSSAAWSADLYTAPEAPPPEAVETTTVIPSWEGGYIGVKGGWSWTDGKFDFGATSSSRNFDGGSIGKFAGYNWQFDNNVVLGIEGDINYTWDDRSFQGNEAGTDWSGSVRGRLGYAMDNTLIYGTAGWAATRGFLDTPTTGKHHKTFNGYTVGAGVDYKFTDNMFARAEYRFNDYGSETIRGVDVDLDQHAFTVGIGFKF